MEEMLEYALAGFRCAWSARNASPADLRRLVRPLLALARERREAGDCADVLMDIELLLSIRRWSRAERRELIRRFVDDVRRYRRLAAVDAARWARTRAAPASRRATANDNALRQLSLF